PLTPTAKQLCVRLLQQALMLILFSCDHVTFDLLSFPTRRSSDLTAAVGLANETINFTDRVEINRLTWGKEEWGDVKVTRVSTSDKPVTLEDALTRSDNIYFEMKAVDMGNENYIKAMQDIGFEENIPFQMPIENSQISNDGKLDEILLANSGYGQGEIEMSSLHIALSYTMFLNEGDMLKPSLLLNKNER